VTIPSQVLEKVPHLLLTKCPGVLPVEADELAHPLEIRLLGPKTVVLDADGIADLVDEGV
jgi:hypothetical protein